MEETTTIVKELSVIDQAKAKISKEITEYENMARDGGIACIMPDEERTQLEGFLFGCIENEDGFAENVLKECKSISNGLQWAARKIPEKMKKLGMVPIDNRTVFEWFAEYYAVDEEKEKAEAEAKRKIEDAKRKANMTADQKKAAEEAKKRAAEAEEARKRKEEEEKRKKLGVCEGQMDLFSMMGLEPEPQKEAPIDAADADSEAPEEFCVDIDEDDLKNLPFTVGLDGLMDPVKEEDSDEEDEEEDLLPWEEGEDDD